jgi:hypothetical protein
MNIRIFFDGTKSAGGQTTRATRDVTPSQSRGKVSERLARQRVRRRLRAKHHGDLPHQRWPGRLASRHDRPYSSAGIPQQSTACPAGCMFPLDEYQAFQPCTHSPAARLPLRVGTLWLPSWNARAPSWKDSDSTPERYGSELEHYGSPAGALRLPSRSTTAPSRNTTAPSRNTTAPEPEHYGSRAGTLRLRAVA